MRRSVLLVGGSSLLLALELLDFQLWEASALAAATLLLARRLLIWWERASGTRVPVRSARREGSHAKARARRMARGEHLARAWVLVPVTLLCSPLFFVLLNVEELRWRRTLAAVSPVLGCEARRCAARRLCAHFARAPFSRRRGLGLSAAASVLLANSVTLCLLWRKLE
jgi:hypothetical protein